MVAPPQIFNCFISRDFQTEVMQEFKILFNGNRAIFVKTSTAFITIVFMLIQPFFTTFGTRFSMKNSFYNFKHNQVNLTLGPKNA